MCSPCFGACIVSFSNEQYANTDLINQACKDNYPSFQGFHGTMGAMTAEGLNDASGLQAFIDSLNIDDLKQNNKHRKDIKQLRKKFKDLGFDNKDLETMGYTNDIPDA